MEMSFAADRHDESPIAFAQVLGNSLRTAPSRSLNVYRVNSRNRHVAHPVPQSGEQHSMGFNLLTRNTSRERGP